MARALVVLIVVAAGFGVWQIAQRAEGAYNDSGAAPSGDGNPAYSFQAELNLALDTCGHDPYIWGADDSPPHNIKLTVEGTFGQISILGGAPWVRVTGTYPGDDIPFVATGAGFVAGLPDTPVHFEGSIDLTSQTVEGTYRFGVEGVASPGHLPPCDDDNNLLTPPEAHAAYYQVKAKPTPTPTRTPTSTATPTRPDIATTSTPTNTPTPTLIPVDYALINATKIDFDTGQPLPNWQFKLYPDPDCTGPLEETFTGFSNGTGVTQERYFGVWYVAEVLQPGWEPVTPRCQRIDTEDAFEGRVGVTFSNRRVGRRGDSNGDGEITSVDAALDLQFGAGLLPSLPPTADANLDGRVDSVDATLKLQHAAGLYELPVM